MTSIEPSDPLRATARASLSRIAVEEQTLALAAPLARSPGAQVSLLCFRAAGERFAVPAAEVQRVFEVQPVRRVPHRKRAAFRGLVAHEGEILMLGSLEKLLELSGNSGTEGTLSRMILIGQPGRGWVFQVEAVDGVVRVPESALQAAPSTLRRGLGTATRMIVDIGGNRTALLDSATLILGWEAAAS